MNYVISWNFVKRLLYTHDYVMEFIVVNMYIYAMRRDVHVWSPEFNVLFRFEQNRLSDRLSALNRNCKLLLIASTKTYKHININGHWPKLLWICYQANNKVAQENVTEKYLSTFDRQDDEVESASSEVLSVAVGISPQIYINGLWIRMTNYGY